jgi:ATP-dependent DNA helicase RecG
MDLSLLPCQKLTGVGKRTADYLSKLGIHHVQEVLFHLPLRYQDRTHIYAISDLKPGEHVVIEGEIASVGMPKGGRTRLLCQLHDATGRIQLRFFYVNKSQRDLLKPGTKLRCFGEVRRGMYGLEMIHPEYKIISADMLMLVEKNLTPIYPTTEGLSQLMWRKLTDQALQMLESGGVLRDILPPVILQSLKFPALKDALQFVHRPPINAELHLLSEKKHIAQKRLVFEELLAHRLSLLRLKKTFQVQNAIPLDKKNFLTKQFLKLLPFELTNAQKKVVEEIQKDLCASHPMLRLVQGDVGSGKTVVAVLAILQAIENNCQACVLAPTELLAEQHFRTFCSWLEPLGIKVVMLSGQMKMSARNTALQMIADGKAQVVLGTHAIFQKNVTFSKLVLIVIDEQHRFGVHQRALLRKKGMNNAVCPHQLVMTATPIPRTLAMSVYADLDYSIIDELPPGRTPVITSVVSNTRRKEVLARIHEACVAGRQAYWVCTLIEESEILECQAAEKTEQELKSVLPACKIALLHGRMKPVEKEKIMAAFKSGEIQLLVATTVIEVGVDVPNASLMIIENAERLGLAQLHQLRGRVGRGAVVSHCLLMYQSPLSRFAQQRLAVLRETTDGFKIAQCDLEIRGPGEVLGTKQTGEISLRIANLVRDSDLLSAVQQAATILQQEYSGVIDLLIKRWLGNSEQYGHV